MSLHYTSEILAYKLRHTAIICQHNDDDELTCTTSSARLIGMAL